MKTCSICGITSDVVVIHTHHVCGRVGPQKDEPYNKIELCYLHHHMWHTNRPDWLEDKVYTIMKERWGDQFPIWVNGVPYTPKWLLKAEGRLNER